MKRVSGWVIAGVICLILITLAVTGIVQFNSTPTQSTPQSSQAFVYLFDGVKNIATNSFRLVA